MRRHEGGLVLTNTASKWISSIYRMQPLMSMATYMTTNLTFHNEKETGSRLITTKDHKQQSTSL